jgi:superfamily I DNA/RNA helicase
MSSLIAYRFIALDANAVAELVQTRDLQTAEFPNGRTLGLLLCGKMAATSFSLRVEALAMNDGLFLLSPTEQSDNVLVIDLESAPLFEEGVERDALFVFQRILRFAVKRWNRMSLSASERIIPNSTKGVIFPYPIATHSSYRITIELSPDARRRARRAKGEELLVYRAGTDSGGGPIEDASTTNFRRALETLSEVRTHLSSRKALSEKQEQQSPALAVTRLHGGPTPFSLESATIDEWLPLLTDAQHEFIKSDLKSPHRLEGPAGTGKTLSLVLKCIYHLRAAEKLGREHRALFVAHSESTRRAIRELFEPELQRGIVTTDGVLSAQSVQIKTLHSYCSEILHTDISEGEFLDKDAFESKQTQLLYALEALEEVLAAELPTHRRFMSEEFLKYLETEDKWIIAQMLQHEISVKIKGRADEDEAKYRRLDRLAYGLPIGVDGDKVFAFLAFKAYRRRLEASGQFDTDDVVLSALGQLNTPIWRRRRAKEGFDSLYIDETHLFNLNELSIFHRLTRSEDRFPIVYSADVSQSLGDRGWTDKLLNEAFVQVAGGAISTESTKLKAIFRCSPDIVNLAFSVTSAGATLFTNFHDPISSASSAFTQEEEAKCAQPIYRFLRTDEDMFRASLQRADELSKEMKCSKSEIALVVFGDELFADFEKYCRNGNKPVEYVKQRGDTELVQRARAAGKFVASTPDYVGGLEFAAVILLGVDKDRMPPRVPSDFADSQNFVSYASHQRLYVAITRAKYRIEIFGLKTRGPSTLLQSAVKSDLVAQVIDP